MRFLVIGLGSMGKRRIRNLQALGVRNIIGYDLRDDRREEAARLYGIRTVGELTDRTFDEFDAAVISTAPDKHNGFLRLMIDHDKPSFIELSLLVQDLPELARSAQSRNVLVAPSCTFRFHPLIRSIKEMVQGGIYGPVQNFSYHTGQYLPDWHPWENIKDYFVSKRETSGCKEILSLELHWMLYILGGPDTVVHLHQRSTSFDADIDDTYAIGMQFAGFAGVLLVDIVSRFATRSLILNLRDAQLRWNWEEGVVKAYTPDDKAWRVILEATGRANAGYNVNLIEEMYIDELRAFLDAAQGGKDFPLSLEEDIKILRIIEQVETARV